MGREARTKLHKIKIVVFFPLSVCGAMTRFLSRNMTYYSTEMTYRDRSGKVILSRKPNLTVYMTIKFLEKIIPHKLSQESRDSTRSHASGCEGDWFKIGYKEKITYPLYITPNANVSRRSGNNVIFVCAIPKAQSLI